jgi:HPt (histidine-containing phosphotransfer) domain-containing protein
MRTEQSPEVFDRTLALSSVGGDGEFLSELVGLVHAALPAVLADIREGLAVGDLRAVAKNARLAKAAAEYVSARGTYESALQLESMVSKEDFQGAQRATANLEQEVERLESVLAEL